MGIQSKREFAHFGAILAAGFQRLASVCDATSTAPERSKSWVVFVTTATLPLVGLSNYGAGRRTHFDRQRRFGFCPQAAFCV